MSERLLGHIARWLRSSAARSSTYLTQHPVCAPREDIYKNLCGTIARGLIVINISSVASGAL